ESSKPIFNNNKFVDEVIIVEDDAFFRIKTEKFDQVINLDNSKLSSSIAAMANAVKKIGFVLNEKGFVESTSEAANVWLEMSAFDNFKRANDKSYQQIMYDILGFSDPIYQPQLFVTNELISKVSDKLLHSGLNKKLETIGLNVGIGSKWSNKGWAQRILLWNLLQLLMNVTL
ncbi:MAG: hypothetical protein MUC75_05660, partial [Ignavibacteriaceae bacterium]|nr:hypothetical protein [Ignavibacteriaceae bacterium]